jgi:hypothetical protein
LVKIKGQLVREWTRYRIQKIIKKSFGGLIMANMFLAGYFLGKTLENCSEQEYGWAVAYGALTALNIVFGICL